MRLFTKYKYIIVIYENQKKILANLITAPIIITSASLTGVSCNETNDNENSNPDQENDQKNDVLNKKTEDNKEKVIRAEVIF
ncbi:hypothetical protein [Mycoplasmopsis synoviae]|uniref:Uncharacterized protein n=1 Tax=Mycoplasmopsis synoviae (strain 53) TaxID=262723 RepID=A4Q803_MYCS5|nr:hypothetical protein [Mycoplasmopsis synoviae]ABP00375.1 hypothetical protein MS53_0701 [Mycoplasmopsis synoviae 53]